MRRDEPQLFRRLRLRMTVACSLVTGLVLAGMALASLSISEAQLWERTSDEFRTSLNAVFLYLRDTSAVDQGWLAQTETSGGLTIYLEDLGRPLLYGGNRDGHAIEKAVAEARMNHGFDIAAPPRGLLPESVIFPLSDGGEYLAAVAAVPLSAGGWLGMAAIKPVPQILRLRLMFAGCVGIAFVCLVVFAWVFTARAIRPVLESRRRQTEFVSAASHELRSPLAVMQASADAMQDAPPEQAKRFARTISQECARLSRLTSDLLLLAGADNSRWTMNPAPAEPETMLLFACEGFEPVAARKGISLRVELPDNPLPRVRCDSQRIGQLLTILLDNAVSYTPEGGHVILRAGVQGHAVFLSVRDDGPGIPEEQKKRVFDRFYRADLSRNQKEHFGLGLSIAKEIAQMHKGTLAAENAPEGGALFTLTLPL